MNFTMMVCMWVGWSQVILFLALAIFTWPTQRPWHVLFGAQAGGYDGSPDRPNGCNANGVWLASWLRPTSRRGD
jgi:hypothetical protein